MLAKTKTPTLRQCSHPIADSLALALGESTAAHNIYCDSRQYIKTTHFITTLIFGASVLKLIGGMITKRLPRTNAPLMYKKSGALQYTAPIIDKIPSDMQKMTRLSISKTPM